MNPATRELDPAMFFVPIIAPNSRSNILRSVAAVASEATRRSRAASISGRETRSAEVLASQADFVIGELHGGDRTTRRACGAGEPERGVAIRSADLQHAPGTRGPDQHRQELTRIPRDIEHPARTL